MSRVFSFLACVLSAVVSVSAADRPNVLWITVEDMSPNLGCYGDVFADTPNLDAFAKQSVRYTHAFASSPVCAPARSTLITGVLSTTQGNPHLRCEMTLPKHFRAYTAWLRDVGYFCSNNVKTDYNLANERAFVDRYWDESSPKAHWRNRPDGKPFFSIFNLMLTHQSRTSVWPQKDYLTETDKWISAEHRADPSEVPVPPFYPDTPAVRQALARYYDCIAAMDRQVGSILSELETDGLADDTIVFFYSDHGMGMPRGKRLLHDSGMRVPLMIRFPEKFRHLAPAAPGQTVDRLVTFVDFPATLLSLLGINVPEHFMGVPFLGEEIGPERELFYGTRDRVDEVYETSRSIRTKRWLYIRNFMPHQSWLPPEGYSDQSPMRLQIRALAAEGKLSPEAMHTAAPVKPIEELYDTQTDPFQLRNLAAEPNVTHVLNRMRESLCSKVVETRDLGFVPESELLDRTDGRPPFYFGQSEAYSVEAVLAAAELVGRPGTLTRQIELLKHDSMIVRYWAVIGLRNQIGSDDMIVSALRPLLHDPASSLRIEAAAVLALRGETKPALDTLVAELNSKDWNSATRAARALQQLDSTASPVFPAMNARLEKVREFVGKEAMALFVKFALEAALGKQNVNQ